MSNLDFSIVDDIVAKHNYDATAIISILQEIQEHYHYIPKEFFPRIAQHLGISQAKAYSVATFYENFSLEPKGKYVIRVCDGTACHVRKSIPILERLKKELGLQEGQKTTDDLMFTVEIVSCLGACGLAPVLTVNDKVHPAMTPEKVVELIKSIKEEEANA